MVQLKMLAVHGGFPPGESFTATPESLPYIRQLLTTMPYEPSPIDTPLSLGKSNMRLSWIKVFVDPLPAVVGPMSMASVLDCGPCRNVQCRISEPTMAPSKSRASLLGLFASSKRDSSTSIRVFCQSVS